jgi:Ca2+-binding EF-hand superfamily protein
MKYPIILLCAAALTSGAALAGEKPASSAGDTFKQLDQDSDGRISATEAEANPSVAANFRTLDGDSDGFVTKREFRRNTQPKPDREY